MKALVIFLIRVYQRLFSPRQGVFRFIYSSPLFSLNPGLPAGCRFQPSCSSYCIQSISRYGLVRGLKVWWVRFIKCR